MHRTIRSIVSLLFAGSWMMLLAPGAVAQSQDSDVVIVVIDGVEYVLDDSTPLPPGFDPFDPSGPWPSDVVIIDDDQWLTDFPGDVPAEYAFFVDPTLPVPDEFAFLVDPRIPIPPEYQFMFDERLPVPPEWEWLFPAYPGPAPTVHATPVAEATPTPEAEPTPETEPTATVEPTVEPEPSPEAEQVSRIAVDLSSLAVEPTVAAEVNDDEPRPVVAIQDAPAPPGQGSSSDLLVPLLIFVAIASTALLAAVPVFWRQRSSADTALRELALTDDLTKLANRRRLDRDLIRHNRSKNAIAAAMIDIDHFKRLNDDYSHAIGDLVLQHVAATISQTVRTNDVAYRYGGEEFCVLLPGATENEAAAVVDRVRQAVEALSFDALDRNVTVSAGVAVAARGGTESDHTLLRRADTALYAAKNSGRNRVMLSSLVENANLVN